MVSTDINNMRIALVCIAKNEDDYIDEWIQYHLHIGFDSIYVYCNDWKMKTNHPQVIAIQWNGKAQQIPAYNNFLEKYGGQFHWVAFFDVDEFLVLKQEQNIKLFLYQYQKYPAISIQWRLFGSKVNKRYANTKSVLCRFIHCQSGYDEHRKTIVNTKFKHVRNRKTIMIDPHSCNATTYEIKGMTAQINHYFCKTYDEFLQKRERGRADIAGIIRDIDDFKNHDFNVIVDIVAFNFFTKKIKQ